MEKTFTKEQLKKAIEYACAMQKFDDYQLAGALLIAYEPQIEILLDSLVNVDDNQASKITLEEIFNN